MLNIEFIDHKSRILDDVISLGNKNSSTLGFMPVGGFQDHAKKKWILVAKEDEELIGYILYRVSAKNFKISITHLCIHPDHRGKKIAIRLLDELKDKYKHSFSGISLSCRKDYKEASRLWERYGFVSRLENRSRSAEENYLVKWWYDFNKTDLFSWHENNSPKLKILLDANIVIKLREKNKDEYEEVSALLADWLTEEIDYYIAPEIYNEIHRDTNRARAEDTRQFVLKKFKEARFDRDESNRIAIDLSKILTGTTVNDISDRKQLAECISSSIEYFVTCDNDVLNKRNDIEAIFDITILSPLELVLEIDQISHKSSYYPVRLAGANQTSQKVENSEVLKLIDKFWYQKLSEKKYLFKNKVRSVLKEISVGDIRTVKCEERGAIAFWGFIYLNDAIEVLFLRIIDNSLSTTLFIQLIHELINQSIDFKKPLIKIHDDNFNELQIETLNAFGFHQKDGTWIKIAISEIIESKELLKRFPIAIEVFTGGYIENLIAMKDGEIKNKLIYKIERKLFPLKFIDLTIPTYIIPIKPLWAGQLFDKYISSCSLFGADASKIWNRENVYYRNVKPVDERFPARILWYLSSEEGFYRQKGIFAVSYLDEVTVDTVKKQFNKFKRYGTYDWDDVLRLAKGDINNNVKAIGFSDTQVFTKPVTYDKITEILLANNRKKNTFTSPLKIDHKIFNDIYRLLLD